MPDSATRSLCMLLAAVTLLAAAAPNKSAPTVASELQPFIDNHSLAGAVTLIASRDQILSVETIGWADISAKKPMRADALFWIASMSKPMTTAALMTLVDEGRVHIDDPVEKYLPEFKNEWLAAEQDKDDIILKHPSRPITVKDILTHTSGLLPTSAMETPSLDTLPLRDAVRSYAMTPLQSEPGAKYHYANAGINTAGRIIEVVSGMSYEDYLAKRLFQPLGMKDTTFWPSEAQVKRLAKSYKSAESKQDLEETSINQLSYPLTSRKRYPMPAGGLFSTGADVARFCQMILAGGSFEGKRILSEAAVRQATTVETGDIQINDDDAMGYGFGWSVLRRPAADGRSAGSFGHGGAYKTMMWIDPARNLVMILMRQQAGALSKEGTRIEPTFFKQAITKYEK